MEHPFVDLAAISAKNMDELQEAIASLSNKLNFAHRTGNQPMANQIAMVLESYRGEFYKKMDALLERQASRSNVSIKKE